MLGAQYNPQPVIFGIPMETLLEIKEIQCRYQDKVAVENLSVHVNNGSLLCLLGPSGCGKTTALRAIAGFEPLHQGEILLHGKAISRPGYTLAPEKRGLGMVFQDYALFPHMDISANIAFGLRGQSKADKQREVGKMLEIVGLDGYGKHYPHELSGGQQQRVALARALAARPALILFDEPFSNLDVELRERLSLEVRQILKEQNMSGILVTHDQHEAFAIGDQIGVMSEGKLLQCDSAFNLYHEPANRFVADFIGQGSLLTGTLIAPDTVETEVGFIQGNRAYKWDIGSKVDVLLRPDDIVHDKQGKLQASVEQKAFKGAETLYTLRLPTGTRVLSLFPSSQDYLVGDTVNIRFEPDHLVAFRA